MTESESSSNDLTEKASDVLKWIALIGGFSYLIGFIVLYLYHLHLTSTGHFEFPDSKALAVGCVTIFIIITSTILLQIHENRFPIRGRYYKDNPQLSNWYIGIYEVFAYLGVICVTLTLVLHLISVGIVVDIDKAQTKKEAYILGATILTSTFAAFLIAYREEHSHPRIYLFALVILILANIAILSSVRLSDELIGVWKITIFIIISKYSIKWIYDQATKIRLVDMNFPSLSWTVLQFIVVLTTFNLYSIEYYPLIDSKYGGGQPTNVVVEIHRGDGGEVIDFTQNTVLLAETSGELILGRSRDDTQHIYRVNKDLVRYIYRDVSSQKIEGESE